jgi:2-polyprenyl-6-methoxyphenol hydroxylase-like FAD-dependent oxidoreductase
LPEGQTYGWGVVFWDELLHELERRDAALASDVRAAAFRWNDQVIDVQGRTPVRIASHGYSMGRHVLLAILNRRARELGVEIRYGHDVHDDAALGHADLVIASDGARSRLRARRQEAFGTSVHRGRNKYIWLGTSRVFDSFTFPFVRTNSGWIWAHAYGFDDRTSTFIVETTPETWRGLGFDRLGPTETMRALEEIFAAQLDGHALRPPVGTGERTPWLEFQTVTNRLWHQGRVALIGDAAHTTHFTIGSGTRLAMQDAIGLADALAENDLDSALQDYHRRRAAALHDAQRNAAYSARWFENLPRYIGENEGRFADLLLARRSPILANLPPRTYLRLADTASTVPSLANPLRKVVKRLGGLPDRR